MCQGIWRSTDDNDSLLTCCNNEHPQYGFADWLGNPSEIKIKQTSLESDGSEGLSNASNSSLKRQ